MAFSSVKNGDQAGTEKPTAPRPALVPAATLTEPETAAAVYNTLEYAQMLSGAFISTGTQSLTWRLH